MISWYTKETFFYRMVNLQLRSGNLASIWRLRLVIFEFAHQLREFSFEKEKNPHFLFRETVMARTELEMLKLSLGGQPLML
jgi:hypothetical protein